MKPLEGRKRVIIEAMTPQVDAGRYPARRVLGDQVTVTAAVFSDGHDHVSARLLYRPEKERRWLSTPMTALGNDLWSATFTADRLANWSFTIQAWVDHFDTWCSDLEKRLAAQPSPTDPSASAGPQDIPLAFRTGALLLDQHAARAKGANARQLTEAAASLRWMADQNADFYENPITPELKALAAQYPDLSLATRYEPEVPLWIDRERARFSTWYETLPALDKPRTDPHRHLRRRRATSAGDRRHGLRRPLPPARSPHRHCLPQRPQQRRGRQRRRPG